jgi:hypothetical protein
MAKKHPKEIGLSDDHVTELEVFIDTYSSKMGIALRTYQRVRDVWQRLGTIPNIA